MYSAQRHVLSDGNSALIYEQWSLNCNLNLDSKLSQFGDRDQVEGSHATNCMVVGMCYFPLPFTVSCTMFVSKLTNQPSIAVACNIISTVLSAYANCVVHNSNRWWQRRDQPFACV